MNIKKLTFFSVGFLLLSSEKCFAEMKVFSEVSQLVFKDSRLQASPTTFSIGGEYSFNRQYSVLAKLGTNLQSDNAKTESEQVNVEVDYLYGIYFKTYMSKSSKLNLFATAGYTKSKLTGDFSAGKLSQSDSGLSLGIGLNYELNKSLGLGINYNQMFDGSESKMSSINYSLSYAF